MTEFVIEKNVPIPQKLAPNSLVATLCKMEIGDSIFLENPTQAKVSQARQTATRKSSFVFVTRKVDGGVRFWRAE